MLEQAGLDCRVLVDEVSAARALLGVEDGAIADVGGGSTGVGVYRDGELVSPGDRPGGGHHLNLILAGGLGLPVAEAERLKRKHAADYTAMLASPDSSGSPTTSAACSIPVPPGRCTWSAAR